MTAQIDAADRALKAKHRAMWAMGNYPAVAERLIPELGRILVKVTQVGSEDRVLDIAAGSGNASIPAALTGADVVATDLAPELLAVGEELAERQGARVRWVEADAEALPFSDDEFDVVLSCVGVMFAPHHELTAAELVRVCRPGGRIGLINWTPEGFIGQMFATMKPYLPPPPPGVRPPPLWGNVDHVQALLGDRVTDAEYRRQTLTVDEFATPEEFRDFFKRNYGPTVTAYRGIAEEPERVSALDRDLVELARRFDRGDAAASRVILDWEYLLVTARKRG